MTYAEGFILESFICDDPQFKTFLVLFSIVVFNYKKTDDVMKFMLKLLLKIYNNWKSFCIQLLIRLPCFSRVVISSGGNKGPSLTLLDEFAGKKRQQHY
jgi:hypothetical protein